MSAQQPRNPPGSDADFEIARRAVERGMLSVEQVEAAIVGRERDPGRRLEELLPLTPAQKRELEEGSARTVPPEAQAAAADPSRRAGTCCLVAKLSEGGMGEVWRAWDLHLGRWVAVKFPKHVGNDRARELFQREVSLLASLDHPNVARIYARGERDGRPFMIMQFIDGRTLDGAGRMAPASQSLRWTRDVTAGVAAAHAAGVIHRDLKPSNVMLDAAGHVYVLDFGLAKETDLGADAPGQSRFAAGTPNYMAPEQAHGRALPQSDIYGIGALFYELVTGRPPFVGATPTDVILQVIDRDPVPPRRLNPAVPADVEAIILKCLEKKPEARYASAEELLGDLEACLEGAPLVYARRRTPLYVVRRHMRRHPAAWSLGFAAAALLMSLLALLFHWIHEPGFLRVSARPVGARVTLGGESWVVSAEPRRVEVAPGAWEVTVEAAGHEKLTTVVVVGRREEKDVTVSLRHDQGQLQVTAEPPESLIEIEGKTHGSRIHGLEIDTGRHEMRAWAPGHFERRRAIEVSRGAVSRAQLSLDRGEEWRFLSSSLQSAPNPLVLPDIDKGGVADLAFAELTSILLLSGETGSMIARFDVSDHPLWLHELADLGHDLGPVLLAASESHTGMRVTVIRLLPRPDVLFSWKEEDRTWEETAASPATFVGDLSGDGIPEFAVAHREQGILVFNVRESGPRRIPLPPGTSCTSLAAFDRGRKVLFTSTAALHRPATRAGVVSLAAGTLDWQEKAAEGETFGALAAPPESAFVFASSKSGWRRLDAAGEPLDSGSWDPEPLSYLVSSSMILEWHRDRVCRWEGPSRRWNVGLEEVRAVARGPADLWLALCADHLVALRDGDGTEAWRIRGSAGAVRFADLDRDGQAEVVAGIQGLGLVALAADGKETWRLHLKGDPLPLGFLPGGDGARLVFGRGGSFVGLARQPRILWYADAAGPLLAPPVIVTKSETARAVVQCGDWGGGVPLRGLDAATGTELWSVRGSNPPNEPSACGDWNADGSDDLALWLQVPEREETNVAVLDGATGAVLALFPLPPDSDAYTTPVIEDLDGDGSTDVFINRRGMKDAWAFAKKGRLWSVPLPSESWGGALATDLDGDGKPDLVVPGGAGPLVALRGTDGAEIWRAPAPTHGTPLRAGPFILAVTSDRELVAVNLRDGRPAFRRPAGDASSQSLTSFADRILVPLGAGGLACLRGHEGAEAWSRPGRVDARAVAGDLDADGSWEVVYATRAGALHVVDADRGTPLWHLDISSEGITASPSLADLDGDGILDILVADRSGRLTAVSGRPTRAARR